MNGLMAVAEGVGSAATVNTDSQLTTGLEAIALVMMYLPLQQAWSKKLSEDAEAIYVANMNVPGNPSGTAGVAAAQQKRTVDSSISDRETGNVNTLIQSQKGAAQILANAMQNAYSMLQPALELMSATTNTIHIMG